MLPLASIWVPYVRRRKHQRSTHHCQCGHGIVLSAIYDGICMHTCASSVEGMHAVVLTRSRQVRRRGPFRDRMHARLPTLAITCTLQHPSVHAYARTSRHTHASLILPQMHALEHQSAKQDPQARPPPKTRADVHACTQHCTFPWRSFFLNVPLYTVPSV